MATASLTTRIQISLVALAATWFLCGVSAGLRFLDPTISLLFFFWSVPLFGPEVVRRDSVLADLASKREVCSLADVGPPLFGRYPHEVRCHSTVVGWKLPMH